MLTPYDIPDESAQPGVLLSPINTGALGLDASISIQPLTLSHETAGEHSTAGFISKRESGKRIALLWDLDKLNDAWVLGGGTSDTLRALQGVDVLFVDCNTWSAEGRGHITFQADIPHGGPDCGAFLSVKPFLPLAQELQQVLMLVGQIEHKEPLPRNVAHMNPYKVGKDPPCGGVLDTLAFLIWKRRPVLLERTADAVL